MCTSTLTKQVQNAERELVIAFYPSGCVQHKALNALGDCSDQIASSN